VLPAPWISSAASIRGAEFQLRHLKLCPIGMCTGAASNHKQLHVEELNALGISATAAAAQEHLLAYVQPAGCLA